MHLGNAVAVQVMVEGIFVWIVHVMPQLGDQDHQTCRFRLEFEAMALVFLASSLSFSPGPASRLAVTPIPTRFVSMAGWGPDAGTWAMPASSEELADVMVQPGVNVVFFGSTRCRACQAERSRVESSAGWRRRLTGGRALTAHCQCLSPQHLLSIQALPLVLRLKADCPNAHFVYASQTSCATAHRQYKADQLPQVLVFKDGAMVTQVAPSGGAMRRAYCPITLAPTRTPP